ncbi:MAG: hypothetical protein H0T59_05510 [Chloroflexi bacterium]|nr:hypothetical protein [Chloroflexota bacterium]
MAFWWVNQAQSYERDRAGGFMWAPLRDSAGHTLGHREAMALIQPGDTVFHYLKGAVRAVSTVTSAAEVTPEPARGMNDRNRIGRLVRVDMTELDPPIRLATIPLDDRLAQPAGPFNVKGGIKRAYLSPVTDAFGTAVLARCEDAPGRNVTEQMADAVATTDVEPTTSTDADRWTSTDAEPRTIAREPPATPFRLAEGPPAVRPLTSRGTPPAIPPTGPTDPAVRDWLERYAVRVSDRAGDVDRPRARLRLERRRPIATTRPGDLAVCPAAVAHLVHQPPMLYRIIAHGDLIRVRLELPTGGIDVLRFTTVGDDHLVASISPGLRRRLQLQAMSRWPRAIVSLLALHGPSSRIADRRTTSLALKRLARTLQSAGELDCEVQGATLGAMLSEFRTAMLSRYD